MAFSNIRWLKLCRSLDRSHRTMREKHTHVFTHTAQTKDERARAEGRGAVKQEAANVTNKPLPLQFAQYQFERLKTSERGPFSLETTSKR